MVKPQPVRLALEQNFPTRGESGGDPSAHRSRAGWTIDGVPPDVARTR
jgi:hypothetical protein